MRNYKILAIAIDEYDDPELNKIYNCLNDLKAIIATLTTKYSFDDVELISGKENTTRKALFNTLNSYFTNSLEDENILLLYAGHGQYNEILQAAYWQPSDADPTDASTWFSISDLLNFIKASKAHHISLISDSCFAGAIFQANTRGGGIEAFNSKKSRLALTSGGIEKVSDGKSGHLSPFANTLIGLLNENTATELPFNLLASNLILRFTNEKTQTPMFGALNDVGHEGGAFIFKMKPEESLQFDSVKIEEFIKDRLKNLFIPVSKKDLDAIEQIKPITEEKIAMVKEQRFDKASKFRDYEKAAIKEIVDQIPQRIEDLLKLNTTDRTDSELLKQLDNEIISYEERRPAREESKKKYDEISTNDENETSASKLPTFLLPNFLFFEILSDRNPEKEFFKSKQNTFIKLYSSNILDLCNYFISLSTITTSKLLKQKGEELLQILYKLYAHEIDLATSTRSRSELESIIQLREIDITLLNWIKNI